MLFLRVAARELRVASRKPSTFRLRLLTSLLALFLSAFSLWFVTLFGSRPIPGEQLFFLLRWVTFACACLVGPALTADSVNEERNNGTLGLLFLTTLSSTSISLGKLFAHGLLALYSIISIVPVMALPALLGGTDAESLAKTAVVLLVTVFLSLIIGMFASTVCRKPWAAAALALLILTVLAVVIPLAAVLLQGTARPHWAARLELLSPSYSLSMASSTAAQLSTNHLWRALGVQLLIALSFFAFTTFLLARVWKEGRSGRKFHLFSAEWRALKYGSREASRTLRARLLHINPILWLSSRDRFAPLAPAMLLLLLAFAISWAGKNLIIGPPTDFLRQLVGWIVGLPLLYIIFCFRLATAAAERFPTDRKTGALELILCTPITTREIIRGHWLGLVRRCSAAALILLALHAFALNYIIAAIRIEESRLRHFNLRDLLVMPLRHLSGTGWIPNELAPYYIGCLAVLTAAILIVILWIALGWLGTALSLKLKREILAPWISLIILAVPPLALFIASLPILNRQELFASNLFLAMLLHGATGFVLVLTNALIWLFLARRWTYRHLARPDRSST